MLAFKYEKKPVFNDDRTTAVVLASDLKRLEETSSRCISGNCYGKSKSKSSASNQPQPTTNDKVTVQQTPRPRCPNGPDTYTATPRPRYNTRLTETELENRNPPVYDQVEPGIFETYMDKTKNYSPLSFLSSRLSQFTKATRIFTTNDRKSNKVAAEFHQACDNIPNTLVIIKSGQYIAGGYTEVAWSSPESSTYSSSPSGLTFLFSVNKERVFGLKAKGEAINLDENIGPSFGNNAIIVDDDYAEEDNQSSIGLTFECPDGEEPGEVLFGSEWFTIDEYEVYKLE